jgi:hypothetical protein
VAHNSRLADSTALAMGNEDNADGAAAETKPLKRSTQVRSYWFAVRVQARLDQRES